MFTAFGEVYPTYFSDYFPALITVFTDTTDVNYFGVILSLATVRASCVTPHTVTAASLSRIAWAATLLNRPV